MPKKGYKQTIEHRLALCKAKENSLPLSTEHKNKIAKTNREIMMSPERRQQKREMALQDWNNLSCIERTEKLVKLNAHNSYGSSLEQVIEEWIVELEIEAMKQIYFAGHPVDFFIPDLNIALEIDGYYYHVEKEGQSDYDKIRDQDIMQKTKIRIIRIAEKEIKNGKARQLLESIALEIA